MRLYFRAFSAFILFNDGYLFRLDPDLLLLTLQERFPLQSSLRILTILNLNLRMLHILVIGPFDEPLPRLAVNFGAIFVKGIFCAW